MQIFRQHSQFLCIYRAVDGEKYDYNINYAYLFNSAYMQNDEWSSSDLKNGKGTEDQILKYIHILDNMDGYVKAPKKESDGSTGFIPYILRLDDYT